MNQDEFARARAKIMAQGFPSSGVDLQGMIEDFHHSLDQSSFLTLRSVKKTGEPERMIEARCEPASDTLTIPEVIAEIERAWMEELRYSHYEAHVVTHLGYEAALEFVTVPAPGSTPKGVSSMCGTALGIDLRTRSG